MRIVVVGAGGQGTVVGEMIALRYGQRDLVGFLDDNVALEGTRVLGVPVLGTVAMLRDVPHDAVVVALGDNRQRAQLSAELVDRGERLIAAVHPHASVSADVEPGAGSMISAGAVVVPGVRLGQGVLLNTRCSIDHHSVISDFVHIGPGATLGANVAVGARALIGLGASVMSGRHVAADAVVGAGALVSRDVPPGATVTGVPARVVRRR